LHEENLVQKPKKKPKRNPQKPRFFERSTPNQMWQTDIFTFRLGGKYAYLIGYIDDYSRFITGMDLFRSQTAENVIGVYRIASAEFNPPKEMLTDNGRQYVNWRGTTKFEKEMKKDRVKHFRSRPHHPMTLGKIERFWKSIFTEFLSRAQFDSYESAQKRIRYWIKYYNHKRPHQGIRGLCPADRYFEIHSELRNTIEKGIKDNMLELALRGKPKSPFYMVGRMGGQSVVIRAEKGKVKMMVDGKNEGKGKEIEYHMEGKNENGGEETKFGKESQDPKERENRLQQPGEMQGGAVGLVGEAQTVGSVQCSESEVDNFEELGGAGAGGDDKSAQPEEEDTVRPGTEQAITSADQAEDTKSGSDEGPLGEASSEDSGIEFGQGETAYACPVEKGDNNEPADGGEKTGQEESGSDHESEGREDDGESGGRGAGGLPQNLLRMGEEGAGGDDGIALESQDRKTGDTEGSGEEEASKEGESTGAGSIPVKAHPGA